MKAGGTEKRREEEADYSIALECCMYSFRIKNRKNSNSDKRRGFFAPVILRRMNEYFLIIPFPYSEG